LAVGLWDPKFKSIQSLKRFSVAIQKPFKT
jgi:hypothetical protein